MFKTKPITVEVTHNIKVDELKDAIEDLKSTTKRYAKVAGGIVLAGIATIILLAVAENCAEKASKAI